MKEKWLVKIQNCKCYLFKFFFGIRLWNSSNIYMRISCYLRRNLETKERTCSEIFFLYIKLKIFLRGFLSSILHAFFIFFIAFFQPIFWSMQLLVAKRARQRSEKFIFKKVILAFWVGIISWNCSIYYFCFFLPHSPPPPNSF